MKFVILETNPCYTKAQYIQQCGRSWRNPLAAQLLSPVPYLQWAAEFLYYQPAMERRAHAKYLAAYQHYLNRLFHRYNPN